jgi:hypothetical protein
VRATEIIDAAEFKEEKRLHVAIKTMPRMRNEVQSLLECSKPDTS